MMLTIFFRSIIIFVLLLFIVRLMGKRQIGEMQPFELVVTLIIADIATIPMSDVSIPLIYGIAGMFTVFILHQLLSFIDRKNKSLSNVISGTPNIVINSKGINFKELQKQNLSVDDLFESLRGAGYASFDEIAFAVFETNGKLSVVPKLSSEMDSGNKAALPLVIMELGAFMPDKMKMLGISESWLKKQLKSKGVTDLDKVQIVTIDNNGKLYIQVKDQGYQVMNTDYRGNAKIW